MANPQKENGYTAIAHEILERLSFPGINGSEYRVLLVVLRKTYGYHKNKDRISLSQFQKNTLMNRSQTVKTINSLVCKRILVKEKGVYKFNKNWDEWVVSKRIPSVQKDTRGSMQKDTKTSMQLDTHKRYKDNNTKDTSTQERAGNEVGKIIDLFKDVNPTHERLFANKTQRSAVERLLKKFGFEKMSNTVKALPTIINQKYAPKITTPLELERDFGKLVAFYNQSKQPKRKFVV